MKDVVILSPYPVFFLIYHSTYSVALFNFNGNRTFPILDDTTCKSACADDEREYKDVIMLGHMYII